MWRKIKNERGEKKGRVKEKMDIKFSDNSSPPFGLVHTKAYGFPFQKRSREPQREKKILKKKVKEGRGQRRAP